MNKYKELTFCQKIKYKEYCDNKFRKTNTFSENGKPLYFDKDGYLINTDLIIDVLFKVNEN
jgi:hypothetical protein